MIVRWWERINRAEVLASIRAVAAEGGCLVLQGDDQAGRRQAGSLAEEQLSRDGFHVQRILPSADWAWTELRALAEAWDAVLPKPAGFQGRGAAELVNLPAEYIGMKLAEHMSTASPSLAFVFDDVGTDSDRHYNLRPAFAAFAKRARRPVVVTYDPTLTQSQWPARHGARVQDLRDFTADDVRECLRGATELRAPDAEEIEDVLELVFAGAQTTGAVRPQQAYLRVFAWSRERT